MAMPEMQPAHASPRRDLTGARLGRFEVRSLLGAGGMGEVYCADDTTLKRRVALKRIGARLRADPRAVQRFRHEAQRASALNHAGIAAIHDLFEADGELLLVMEYVEGQTLRGRCLSPPAVAETVGVLRQCADAVAAAHDKHIVHLDLKPENIMETATGQVKVLDFGVAHQLGPASESMSTSSASGSGGTMAYMAPEQLLGRAVDERADVFALGVVAYELLTGRHPFAGASWGAMLDNILHSAPPPVDEVNAAVSPALALVIGRMLARDPDERYASAREVVHAFDGLMHPSHMQTVLAPPAARSRSRRILLFAVPLLAAVVLGGVLLVLRGFRSTPAMPAHKHVAVLPFRALGKPDVQGVSDGLTETLTAKLTQLTAPDALAVAPASDVRALKNRTVEQARRELGVTLALEGSLYANGDAVQVNYSLVDARTLRSLRSETMTAQISNAFSIEDAVIQGALRMLDVKAASGAAEAGRGTAISSAYEYYLRGLGELTNMQSLENLERAIADFSQALALDPKYALAYAGIGYANWKKYEINKQTESVEVARQNCRHAMELDANTAPAHVCLGVVESGTGHVEAGVKAFQRALQLDSRSDEAYRGLAQAYERLGSFAEAENTYQRAIALRPQYWGGYSALGVFYFHRARYDDAARQFRTAASQAPENARPYAALGGVLSLTGNYPEALDALRRSVELRPSPNAYINLGYVYFRLRRYEEAAVASQQAVAVAGGDYRPAGNLAETYYWQPGQRAQSAEWFRRAIGLAENQLKVNPKDWFVHATVAKYYAYLGDKTRARQHLTQALAGQPNEAGIHYRAAVIHNLFGEREAALQSLQKSLALGYAHNEVSAAVEFDNLRREPRLEALLRK